jgi:dUTPase
MLANSVGIIAEAYRGELIVAIRVLHSNIGMATDNVSYPGGMVKTMEARPTSITEVANLIIGKRPKIAQMILKKRIDTVLEEADSLDDTDRGAGGFGSTDTKK